MDLVVFLQAHADALIAFVGVALGGLLTFAIQARQRRWALDDQRREWKRQRLQEQLTQVLAWAGEWLRLAYRMREPERILLEAKRTKRSIINRLFPSIQPPAYSFTLDELKRRYKQQIEQGDALALQDATIASVIGGLGDDELSKLYCDFMALRPRYRDVVHSPNPIEAAEANSALLAEVEQLVIRLRQRASELTDATFTMK
jgi:hypothetical protein